MQQPKRFKSIARVEIRLKKKLREIKSEKEREREMGKMGDVEN